MEEPTSEPSHESLVFMLFTSDMPSPLRHNIIIDQATKCQLLWPFLEVLVPILLPHTSHLEKMSSVSHSSGKPQVHVTTGHGIAIGVKGIRRAPMLLVSWELVRGEMSLLSNYFSVVSAPVSGQLRVRKTTSQQTLEAHKPCKNLCKASGKEALKFVLEETQVPLGLTAHLLHSWSREH